MFYSAKGHDKSMRGLPDGFKIDKNGNVFATGPGGVYIFDKTGKKLGLLSLSDPTSNCALSKDQKTLYITNNNKFLRWKLR
jgi:gluconolactonase